MGSSNETRPMMHASIHGAQTMGNRWFPAGLPVALRQRGAQLGLAATLIQAAHPPACR